MTYISLDVTNDIQTSQLDALELAKKIQKERLALVSHILSMLINQGQKTEDAVNNSSAAMQTSNDVSAPAAPLTFVWPGDDTQPNPPFDSSIPPKEKGETDAHYYLRVLKKLEQMISWQKNHPMNINGESTLLTFMVNFVKTFPQGLTLANQNLMLTLMQNLIASVYVDSKNKPEDVAAAIHEIQNLFAGVPALQKVIDAFNAVHGFEIDTYNKKYSRDGTGKPDSVIDWQSFLLRAGGALASVCVNDLPSLMKTLYDKELEEIYKLYLACKNPFLYYLMLLSIIGQKETDTQNNVAGCGDMLKLLSQGESNTSDAMSALSVIINMLKGKTDDLDICSTFIKAIVKAYNADTSGFDKIVNSLTDNDLKMALNEFKKYPADYDMKTEGYGNQKADIYCIKIITAHSSEVKDKFQFMKDFDKTYGIDNLNSKINDWETFCPTDAAKKLAQAFLTLQEMTKNLEALLPGIKDATKKLFGDGDGDFFTLTKLDQKTLEKAVYGTPAEQLDAQKAISNAIYAILPKESDSSANPISTINSDINRIGSFFNDQNSQEQAQAQIISSNDQKMLSFIQEMYKQPGDFIKAIQQFMQKG